MRPQRRKVRKLKIGPWGPCTVLGWSEEEKPAKTKSMASEQEGTLWKQGFHPKRVRGLHMGEKTFGSGDQQPL